MTCDRHMKKPVIGYSECAGCEVERLTADYMAHEQKLRDHLGVIEGLRLELTAMEAELTRLRAEVEILVWNLAGISTMACRRTPILYNGEMARPALDEVAELVKDYARILRHVLGADAEIERLKAILADALEWGMTSKHFDAGRSLKNGEDARAALYRAEQTKMEVEK